MPVFTAILQNGVVFVGPSSDGSNGQVITTDGSGNLSFASNAGTTINNNANNYLITGSDSTATLEAESGLTYDGSVLTVTGVVSSDSAVETVDQVTATLTDITQGLTVRGMNVEGDYTSGSFWPGVVWSSDNNNATKPKAAIYAGGTASGSTLYIGISDNYATGITKTIKLTPADGALYTGSDVIIPALSSNVNNQVVTATGSAPEGLTGEANFTFDGSTATIAGVITVSSSNTPVILGTRTSSETNALQLVSRLHADTDADMVDGFGPQLQFSVEDSGTSDTTIGYITAYRDGADNTGRVDIAQYEAGVAGIQLSVTGEGVQVGNPPLPSANATKVLAIGLNGATNPTLGANSAALFAKDVSASGELFAIGEGGGANQISGNANFTGTLKVDSDLELDATAYFTDENVLTPSGGTSTIDLDTNNHHKLDLTSATTHTVTLTATASRVVIGTITVKQHASAAIDITWVAGSGITTGVWCMTEPSWSTDTAAKRRVITYKFDGTDIYLIASDEETATF